MNTSEECFARQAGAQADTQADTQADRQEKFKSSRTDDRKKERLCGILAVVLLGIAISSLPIRYLFETSNTTHRSTKERVS